jgi:hypothetical protein
MGFNFEDFASEIEQVEVSNPDGNTGNTRFVFVKPGAHVFMPLPVPPVKVKNHPKNLAWEPSSKWLVVGIMLMMKDSLGNVPDDFSDFENRYAIYQLPSGAGSQVITTMRNSIPRYDSDGNEIPFEDEFTERQLAIWNPEAGEPMHPIKLVRTGSGKETQYTVSVGKALSDKLMQQIADQIEAAGELDMDDVVETYRKKWGDLQDHVVMGVSTPAEDASESMSMADVEEDDEY